MVSPRQRNALFVALAAALSVLSLPASSALAIDRFVDDEGLGDFPCTDPQNPCATIGTALNVPSVSGDVIRVGGGSYPGNLTLPDGVSLIKDSFPSGTGIVTTGIATINTTGSANPAVTLSTGPAARTISGFTLRGGNSGGSATLIVPAPSDHVTISGNTFDDHSASVPQQLRITSGSPEIIGNTFIGANDGTTRRAIGYATAAGGSPVIGSNAIDSFFEGIRVSGTQSPATVFDIRDNRITNVYDEPSDSIPIAISTGGASGQLNGNLATEIPAQDLGQGMDIITGLPGTGITLEASHNQVYGFSSFAEFGTPDPVVLTDDVFSGGLSALAIFSAASATLRNVTAVALSPLNGDVLLSNAPGVTIDSSFVGSHGVTISGTSTCTSSFSVSTAASPGCGLSTIADPLFANPAANDFRPLSGSPLIDAGNPGPPATGETDIDGNPRAVAVVSCPARRDIGAYELNSPRDCTPPDSTAPDTTVSGKRKVRTRKKKARVTFTFTSSEPGSTFACSLDGRPFAACGSPLTVKLRRGAHTLTVRSTDAAGNQDATPGSFTTKVKRKRK